MLTATDPLLHRRLQARTRLVVDVFDGIDDYGHDYGSYGHESADVLWWYDESGLNIAPGEAYHDQIMPMDDFERYFRGRYSPVNATISLCPAYDYAGGIDYNIPREVFEALETRFPDAVEVEIF